jgi:hypothetical protein
MVSRRLDYISEKEGPAPTPTRTARRSRKTRAGQEKVRSKVWCSKPKADDEKDDELRADINMVVLLPKEFMAPLIRMCPMKNIAWLN